MNFDPQIAFPIAIGVLLVGFLAYHFLVVRPVAKIVTPSAPVAPAPIHADHDAHFAVANTLKTAHEALASVKAASAPDAPPHVVEAAKNVATAVTHVAAAAMRASAHVHPQEGK